MAELTEPANVPIGAGCGVGTCAAVPLCAEYLWVPRWLEGPAGGCYGVGRYQWSVGDAGMGASNTGCCTGARAH